MKTMRNALLAAVGFLAAVQSVAAEDEPFQPFVKGNRWEYTDGYRTWVQTVEESDGKTALLVTEVDGELFSRTVIRIDEDGIKETGFENSKGAQKHATPIVLIKFPVKKGTQWKQSYTLGGMRYESTSTVLGEDGVAVPAGTFRAVVIRVELKYYGGATTVTTWHAPGVGPVKQVMSVRTSGSEAAFQLELTKYELKRAAKKRQTRRTEEDTDEGGTDLDAMWKQGNKLIKAKKFAEAEKAFSKMIEADPNSDLGWLGRAMARLLQGRPKEALKDANKAIKLDPKKGYSRWLRGEIHFALGDYDKAVADMKKAAELDPELEERVQARIQEIEEKRNGGD